MKSLSFLMYLAAGICALIGMAWGIQMSASGDHLMAPAHAHLNLLGFVSLAIFGTFYHLVPSAADSSLGKIQAATAVLAVVLLIPGIVMAIRETGETLAKLGSVVALISMVLFVLVVAVKGRATA